MKTKVLMIALAVILFSNAQAQVPSYVPTNGLVGWWPFNGNANDESGNGNNGTVNGAALTNDRFNNGNSSYNFNGTTNFIEVNDNNTLDFSNMYSISVWVKIPDYSFNQNSVYPQRTMIGKPRPSLPNVTTGIAFRVLEGVPFYNNNSKSYVSAWTNTTINSGIGTSDSVTLNLWCHLVFTYDGSVVKLYKNGMMMNSINASYTLLNTPESLFFGKEHSSNNNNARWFKGQLDDIGIWDRALTQQEITNLYNSSAYVPCASPAFPANLANGLVGYWPFCGDANDESGNGNNGTVNGATLTSDRFGNPNSAFEFDGTSNYISIPAGSNSSLNLTSDLTLSFWIKSQSQNNSGIVSFGDNVGGTGGYNVAHLATSNLNNLSFINNHLPNSWIQTNLQLNNNAWNNFIISQHLDTVRIFKNGTLQFFQTGYLSPVSYGGNRIIGAGSQLAGFFQGQLDDISMWSRALSASEVQQLYNTGIYFQTVTGSCDTLQFNANITGFNPVTYQNQVKVFPNPAKDNLVIDCGANFNTLTGFSIKILNTMGQSVYNSLITQQITNIQLIAPTWSNGAYVVQFINPSGTVIEAKQIIIQ